MILGRVSGTVVATAQHPAYDGKKLLLVTPIDEAQKPCGADFIAVDHAQAGHGDTVLVLVEGTGVRQILNEGTPPILELIVGIVDHAEAQP